MKCKQVRELIGAYLYGDLSPAEMREVRLHTQECAECREDLRERGCIIASLDDEAPTLSDSDRQSIAWSVKGTVRQQEQEREYSRVRFSPAYAVIVVIAVGLVLGSTISARMRPPKHDGSQQVAIENQKDGAKPKARATVEITEERVAQNPPKDENSNKIPETVIQVIHSAIPAAVPGPSARDQHPSGREDAIKQDDTLPVVPHDEVKQLEENSDATRLPKPQDINDAQTTTDTTNDR